MNGTYINWSDSRGQGADLELNNSLQSHISDQDPTSCFAAPFLTDSSAPSWLFGNGPVSNDFGSVPAYAQPAGWRSNCLHSALLQADTQSQTPQQCNRERSDELLHRLRSGPGPGSPAGPSKPASSGKRTEAWHAKNRRAQKKFREKQKVQQIVIIIVVIFTESLNH